MCLLIDYKSIDVLHFLLLHFSTFLFATPSDHFPAIIRLDQRYIDHNFTKIFTSAKSLSGASVAFSQLNFQFFAWSTSESPKQCFLFSTTMKLPLLAMMLMMFSTDNLTAFFRQTPPTNDLSYLSFQFQ